MAAFDDGALESMEKLKKVELHLHLGGSFPLSFLKTIATSSEIDELGRWLAQLEEKVNYHDGFKVFELVGKIVNTNKKIEDGTRAVCASLIADGVSYVEIRTGLKDLGSGLEEYLLAVLRGLRVGCENNDLVAACVETRLGQKCNKHLNC